MDSKNNYKLIMISPIPRDYIYKTNTIDKAGKKALEYLSKNFNITQSKIILKDIDTNKEYNFMAIKNNKQKGGAAPNTDFIEKVNKFSKIIDESVESLQLAVKEKETHENENNLTSIAKNSLSELKNISSELENLNKKIDAISGLDTNVLNSINDEVSSIKNDIESNVKK